MLTRAARRRRAATQGVHEQIAFGPSSSVWGAAEARVNKMVFIGRNLNREQLEAGFRQCLVAAKQ